MTDPQAPSQHEEQELRELRHRVRVLARRLERSEAHRARLEELKESGESLHRRLLAEANAARRALEARNEELQRMTQELEDARLEAQRGHRAKAALLAQLSHELRTPLASMLGVTELLADTVCEPQQRELVGLLKTASHNLEHLIDDVLDLARAEAKALPVRDERFDPRELLEEVVDLVAVDAARRNLDLVLDAAPGLPGALTTDRDRLRQALFRLASNAVRHTPSGAVTLLGRRQGDRALLAVRDEGPGLAPEQVERLFAAFGAEEMTAGDAYGGTGLGLAYVQATVSALGGELSVETRRVGSDTGTTIGVLLPLPADPPHTSESEGARARGGAPGWASEDAQSGERRRAALVMLDSPGQRLAASRHLRAKGWKVTAVGPQADLRALGRGPDGEDPAWGVLIVAPEAVESAWATAGKAGAGVVVAARVDRLVEAQRASGPPVDAYVSLPPKRAALWAAVELAVRQAEARAAKADATVEEADAGAPHEPTPHDGAEMRPGELAPVLVVEDDPINRRLVGRLLERRGVPYEVAEDGGQALERATERRYGLVLMDCRMPVLDGLEATRRMRAGGPNAATPIVALTANVVAVERQRCLEAGMTEVLGKPVRSKTLYEVIERLTGMDLDR